MRLEGKRWREPLFVPIGLGVWLCHVSGWGALGVMVFAYEWHREKSWRPFVAPWPLMAPFLTTLFAGEGTKELASYGTNALTYKWTIWKQAMKDQIEWLDYASAILIGAVLFLSLCFRRLDGRLGWAAVAMLGLAVVMVTRMSADFTISSALAAGRTLRSSRTDCSLQKASSLSRLRANTWISSTSRTAHSAAIWLCACQPAPNTPATFEAGFDSRRAASPPVAPVRIMPR